MGDARTILIDALANDIGVPPLTPTEIESLLSLAGTAAHGTGDRPTAPLASFLAGLAAAGWQDRAASIADTAHRVGEVAPSSESGAGNR